MHVVVGVVISSGVSVDFVVDVVCAHILARGFKLETSFLAHLCIVMSS